MRILQIKEMGENKEGEKKIHIIIKKILYARDNRRIIIWESNDSTVETMRSAGSTNFRHPEAIFLFYVLKEK
jgi:hypothetical protein